MWNSNRRSHVRDAWTAEALKAEQEEGRAGADELDDARPQFEGAAAGSMTTLESGARSHYTRDVARGKR